MASISELLQAIMNARYGEQVRGSIHDAIDAINTESHNAMVYAKDGMDSAKASATQAQTSATNAQTEANNSKTEADRAKSEADRASTIVGIGIATTTTAGIVKPDGSSILVDTDGTIKCANNMITDAWTSGGTYAVGSYAIYNNTLYKCIGNGGGNSQPDTSPTVWQKVSVGSELKSVNSDIGGLFKIIEYRNPNALIIPAGGAEALTLTGTIPSGYRALGITNYFAGSWGVSFAQVYVGRFILVNSTSNPITIAAGDAYQNILCVSNKVKL